ncbi:MAG: ArsA-related P-loop ATPase [Myxococcota bacterium]|nr:ArsA-related P-loop ATPase [Myxococcota bacterium]
MNSQVVICCGSGGVGKTTTSAALGLRWAHDGDRVCVLTIDPAKRLADSLNIDTLGGRPTPIDIPDATGRCDAVMLDVQETFESLIQRFAPTTAAAASILENRYFQFASTRLGGVHEYMAAEKLRELATNGQYDVVIVDTPPTRNALDFLDAPDRMAELMNGAVVRWLAAPATKRGWRGIELGGEAVTRVLNLLIGQNTIGEIAQFFNLFRDLGEGFQKRSVEVQDLLRAESTRFLLVTSPSSAAQSEALFFLRQLNAKAMPFGGFIVNRVEPHIAFDGEALPVNGPDGWAVARSQLLALAEQQARLARMHEVGVDALVAAGPEGAPVWPVPHQGAPVNSIDELAALSASLPTRDALRHTP